jgi:hypothetical protein
MAPTERFSSAICGPNGSGLRAGAPHSARTRAGAMILRTRSSAQYIRSLCVQIFPGQSFKLGEPGGSRSFSLHSRVGQHESLRYLVFRIRNRGAGGRVLSIGETARRCIIQARFGAGRIPKFFTVTPLPQRGACRVGDVAGQVSQIVPPNYVRAA